MLDDISKWINWFFDLGQHSPDLLSLVVGSVAAFAATIALEAFFLPNTTDPEVRRRQKGYTFLVCWGASSMASSGMWFAIDPIDPPHVRWIVCIVVSAPCFFAYPIIARYLTAKFPAIGTAWDGITK